MNGHIKRILFGEDKAENVMLIRYVFMPYAFQYNLDFVRNPDEAQPWQ